MTFTVGELIAEFLAANSVKTAFGIVSIHNIPMLDAIGRRGEIRFIPTRGETGAGHMADAYARVSGGLGVLMTSTGPGAANAVPALVEAKFASTPVLHITGQTAVDLQGKNTGAVHDLATQTAMLATVCKSIYSPTRSEDVLKALIDATCDAMTAPCGPVTLEIAADLQPAMVARPASMANLVESRPVAHAGNHELTALADQIAGARRPMIWMGNGARAAGPHIQKLLDLGFGAVSSWNGRGIVSEDDPRTLGALHGNGAPEIEDFYETVDLLLVVGSRLRGHETLDGALRLPKKIVRIDLDPEANRRGYDNQMFVCADAASTLSQLNRLLAGRLQTDPKFHEDLQAARTNAARAYKKKLGPYALFPEQLRQVMPRNALWVRDATVAGHTWAHRLMPVYGPRDSVHPIAGGIGPGLPFGIGASIAARYDKRKTVMMSGDGGFALNMTELWTAVQENADICIIIMNDGIYAAIGFIQDARQMGRRYFGALHGPDLQGLAGLAGIPFWRVDRAEAFGETVAKALALTGPSMVEVDMKSIGAVPPYGHVVRPKSILSPAAAIQPQST